jgi:tRNA pseudouridine38-40 synthase
MSLLLLRVAYDGTDFSGCPVLPGRRTICGTIADALARVGAAPVTLEALSRTDAGVHARGNVVVVVPGRPLAPDAALRALDHHLPPDLRCVAAASVPAAPTAGAKTYAYDLDLSPWGDPARARVAWRPPSTLAPAVLPALAAPLEGVRDFAAFHRAEDQRPPRPRHLRAARWDLGPDRATFTVTGDGFGYRLVRSLVGGMVAVATGACDEAAWIAALDGIPSHASRQTAPARGLTLVDVAVDAPWTDR